MISFFARKKREQRASLEVRYGSRNEHQRSQLAWCDVVCISCIQKQSNKWVLRKGAKRIWLNSSSCHRNPCDRSLEKSCRPMRVFYHRPSKRPTLCCDRQQFVMNLLSQVLFHPNPIITHSTNSNCEYSHVFNKLFFASRS